MAYALFFDESGTDLKRAPYAVYAGVAIQDADLWPLITDIHDAELTFFGQRMSNAGLELKASKLLKTKVFRHAQGDLLEPQERTRLALEFLELGRGDAEHGKAPRSYHFRALGQAKLAFCSHVLGLLRQHRAQVFASVVDRDAPRSTGDFLGKEHTYLFQRFAGFLRHRGSKVRGFMVFDELDRAQCHHLLAHLEYYFKHTATGRARAECVIPEPFFVHSDLTTLIQVADLAAYVINWGMRDRRFTAPARDELFPYADIVRSLEYHCADASWRRSFTYIRDLRPNTEKGNAGPKSNKASEAKV